MTKIRVSKTSGKMYSHAYRFTNSTTANFSYVQPLCCRFVYPKGSIKGSLKQFMRLSAMPRPTFGDITMNNLCSFVPIEDVYPAFSSLMSELPYTTASGGSSVPKSMPFITPAVLNKILTTSDTKFHSCDATVYNISASTNPGLGAAKASESSAYLNIESIESIDIMTYTEYKEKFYSSYISDQMPCISSEIDEVCVYDAFMSNVFKAVEASKLTDEEAERAYLHHFYDIDKPSVSRASNVADVNAFMKFKDSYDYFVVNYTDANNHTLTCYRFTDLGKQLRKIFLGLGYTYSRDDNTHLNVLPLIACYKAFYDRFIPARDIPFSATAAFGLIQFIEQNPNICQIQFDLHTDPTASISGHFTNFVLNCLSNMFSTQDVNFYSLHMRSLDNGFGASIPDTIPYHDLDFIKATSKPEDKPAALAPTGYVETETGILNAVSIRLLQKMYGYCGRNSLIGNRIEQWAKLHLDSDVYNNLFKKSSVISSNSFHVQIGDIDATAGTRSETTSDGETVVSGNVLGDYAGKGIGSGELTFKASFNTYGYFIVLSWIDPQTSMYQGTDAQLCALTKYEVPQAAFDALGYELTPRSCVWTDNDISLKSDKQASSTTADVTIDNNKSFGYVPRYSGFKYAKNIVNGDFSLNSLQNSMESYYLDRKLTSRQLNVKYNKLSPEKTAVFVTNSFIPQASEQWRYTQRYDWLSNYNRIFVNSSAFKYYPFLSGVVIPGNLLTDYQWPLDDNFYIHCVFDITENTPLKPLSQSYDTQVKSNDGSTIVNPA